jgi:hypothetical protein
LPYTDSQGVERTFPAVELLVNRSWEALDLTLALFPGQKYPDSPPVRNGIKASFFHRACDLIFLYVTKAEGFEHWN